MDYSHQNFQYIDSIFPLLQNNQRRIVCNNVGFTSALNVELKFPRNDKIRWKIKLTGKPSNVQTNWGGGFPLATHFSETVGPGCRVCSENQYNNSGDASN